MNITEMTSEDFKRYGIEAFDLPDIWEQFDEYRRGILRSSDEQELEEDIELQIQRDEAIAEGIRYNEMEYWDMESEGEMHSDEAMREAELEAIRKESSEKDKGLER